MTAGPSVACRPVPIVWIFASASGRFLSVLACQPVGSVPPPAIFASGSWSCAAAPAAAPNESNVQMTATANRAAGIADASGLRDLGLGLTPARCVTRPARAVDSRHRSQPRVGCAAAAPALVAQGRAVGAGARGGAGRRRPDRPRRGVGARMAVAPRGARGARGAARGAAAGRAAGVFRRVDAQRDRPAARPAARHGEDAAADRAPEAGRDTRSPEGLVGMTDWLGMAASPRSPPPELKARVLARALERRRWMWALAAAALLVVLAG